jgi:hypothetical protein
MTAIPIKDLAKRVMDDYKEAMAKLPKPWVGLTDEEIDRVEDAIDPAMYRVFARRVEALLKERNS